MSKPEPRHIQKTLKMKDIFKKMRDSYYAKQAEEKSPKEKARKLQYVDLDAAQDDNLFVDEVESDLLALLDDGIDDPVPAQPQTIQAAQASANKSSPPVPDSNNPLSHTGVYDGLAKLDKDAVVDKNYLAHIFGVSEKTIRRRVTAGELPPPLPTKFRRQPLWLVGTLRDFLEKEAKRVVDEEEARRQHIRNKTE